MRHVPIAEFQDRVSEIIEAAEAGETIAFTRQGREILRLVNVEGDIERDPRVRQRAAFDAAYALGQEIKAKYGPTTSAEIRGWIEEGRS